MHGEREWKRSTWIRPCGLDIGVIVVGKVVGAREVEVQRGSSLLQGFIHSLGEHVSYLFHLCNEE